MNKNLVMVRLNDFGAEGYILGIKPFFKNLFRFDGSIYLDKCFLLDYTWDHGAGVVSQVIMNSFKTIKALDICIINKNGILFQTVPGFELEELYYLTQERVKNSKEL